MKRSLAGVAVALLLAVPAHPVLAQTGEIRFTAGFATGIGSGGLSPSPVTMASFSFVKSSFSFGPEVLYVYGDPRIFGIGVVSRLTLGSRAVRPYLVGGLGGDYWKRSQGVTAGLFTASLGAGFHLSRHIIVEGRVHQNLQNYTGGGNWDFVTIMAGGKIGW
jgi:hypothetical protein